MSSNGKSRTMQSERQIEDECISNQEDMQKEVREDFEKLERRSTDHRRQQRERFAKYQLKSSNKIPPNFDTEKLRERQVHIALIEKRQKEVAAFLEERAKARREFQLEKARKLAQLQQSDSSSTASIASTPRKICNQQPQH